jgi:hypothetical protein
MGKPNGKTLLTPEEEARVGHILRAKTQLVEIPIGSLNVDPDYQERKRRRIGDQIKRELYEGMLGVLKVSQRPDGTYWVIDGETRREAILNLEGGDSQRLIRCELYQVPGPREESLLFAIFNSKRSHEPTNLSTNLQAYKVAETDHGFGKAIEECGYTFKGKFAIRGPHYVEKAWDLDGDGTAVKKALWSMGVWRQRGYPIYGYLIEGVARLHHTQRPRAVDDQVRRILQRLSPDELMEKVIRRYARSSENRPRMHPDDKPKLVAKEIALEINKSPGKAGKIDLRKLGAEDNE